MLHGYTEYTPLGGGEWVDRRCVKERTNDHGETVYDFNDCCLPGWQAVGMVPYVECMRE